MASDPTVSLNPQIAQQVSQQVANVQLTLGNWPGQLVAVTKTATLPAMQAAFNAGLTHFAENTVQALQAKQAALTHLPIQWHLIGPLQRNKVRKVVGKVALIHSVDSWPLAQKLSDVATELGCVQPVLLQVNLAAEPQKQGFSPAQLLQPWPSTLPGVRIDGLMLIAPDTVDKHVLKQLFIEMAAFLQTCRQKTGLPLPQLSMGMSKDFDIAITCGATIIRVGSRLFA
jgi:PLP dependent protein